MLTLNMEIPTGKKQLHDWLEVKDIDAIFIPLFLVNNTFDLKTLENT